MASLERVETFKYLGIQFASELSWHSHTKVLCKKSRKLVGLLHRNFATHSPRCYVETIQIFHQIKSGVCFDCLEPALEMQYQGHGKGTEVRNKSLPKAVGQLD